MTFNDWNDLYHQQALRHNAMVAACQSSTNGPSLDTLVRSHRLLGFILDRRHAAHVREVAL